MRNFLNGLGVHINKGEHIGIAGRNGSGKTTLVKMLVNLYPEYEGNIRGIQCVCCYNKCNCSKKKEATWFNRHCGCGN